MNLTSVISYMCAIKKLKIMMLNAEGQVKCTNVVVKVRSIELSLIAIYYAFEKLKHSMSQFLLLSSVAIVKGKLV